VDICRNAHRVCVLVEIMENLRGVEGREGVEGMREEGGGGTGAMNNKPPLQRSTSCSVYLDSSHRFIKSTNEVAESLNIHYLNHH